MAYIQGESRSQTSLFPASLEGLIPKDHLVRVIDLYVAKLDLGQLGFDKVSRRAQEEAFERMAQRMQLHPEMMERRRSIVEHPCGISNNGYLGTGASCCANSKARELKWLSL